MDLCSFKNNLNSIPLLREEYQSRNTIGVVKDLLVVLYSSDEDEYRIRLRIKERSFI